MKQTVKVCGQTDPEIIKLCIEQGDRFHVTFQVALHECALAERIGWFLQLPCKALWETPEEELF